MVGNTAGCFWYNLILPKLLGVYGGVIWPNRFPHPRGPLLQAYVTGDLGWAQVAEVLAQIKHVIFNEEDNSLGADLAQQLDDSICGALHVTCPYNPSYSNWKYQHIQNSKPIQIPYAKKIWTGVVEIQYITFLYLILTDCCKHIMFY